MRNADVWRKIYRNEPEAESTLPSGTLHVYIAGAAGVISRCLVHQSILVLYCSAFPRHTPVEFAGTGRMSLYTDVSAWKVDAFFDMLM